MNKTILFLTASILTINVIAQDSTQTKVTDKPAIKDFLNITGYVDMYYQKNLNDPKSGSNLGSSGFARCFDQKENQLQLGLAQIKAVYTYKHSEAVIDLGFGPNADVFNYGNVIGPLGLNKATSAIAVKQAYFAYRPNPKLTITGGQFATHIGYEVTDAPVNYHYSLSNLFNNGPFYHEGLKVNYAVSDKFGIMAGVVNNWDNLYDNNKYKSIIGQVYVMPVKNMNVYINYIGGKDDSQNPINETDTIGSFKQLIDLTLSYQIHPKFLIGLNAAHGNKSKILSPTATDTLKRATKQWGGAALYTVFTFNSKLDFGIRAELFDNTDGIQYIGATDVQSYTATFNIKLDDGHFLIKPEVRMDTYKKVDYTGPEHLDVQQFEDSRGFKTKNSQVTVGATFIYKF